MVFHSSLEPLEPRIAPAKLISASAFSYTDIDGDTVRVTFSKPILTAANFDTLVNLTGGLAGTGNQDLIGLDLVGLPATANGLNIAIVATPTRTAGDGAVSGVYIDAFDYDTNTDVITGIDLGVVNIDGDLTSIDAGDADGESFSIRSLTARSIGLAEPGVISDIFGPVGTVKVLGDFAGYLYVESDNLILPDFKSISIGGSVLGNLGEDAGRIFAFAGIDVLTVRGDIVGGGFDDTGVIRSAGPIEKITIGGSIYGGDGLDSGRIRALEFGPITVRGSLVGGFGNGSGSIETYYGNITSLTIYGSIYGGRGDNSGSVRAGDSGDTLDDDGTIGTMTVRGSVIGFLPDSGKAGLGLTIRADNSIGKLTIKGALMNANIVAGILAGADQIYGTDDDELTAGFPDEPRQLGPLVIGRGVFATTAGFAITADRIASIQAGGPALKPGGAYDFAQGFTLGIGPGIRVVEF